MNKKYPGGIALVGSTLIGIGVGLLLHDVAAYTVLGIGVGFVLTALMRSRAR